MNSPPPRPITPCGTSSSTPSSTRISWSSHVVRLVAQCTMQNAMDALCQFETEVSIPPISASVQAWQYAQALDRARHSIPATRGTRIKSLWLLYTYLRRFEEHTQIASTPDTRSFWTKVRGIHAVFAHTYKTRSLRAVIVEIEYCMFEEIEGMLSALERCEQARKLAPKYWDAISSMLIFAEHLHALLTQDFADLHTPIAQSARTRLREILSGFMTESTSRTTSADIERTNLLLEEILCSTARQIRDPTTLHIAGMLSPLFLNQHQKDVYTRMLIYWHTHS